LASDAPQSAKIRALVADDEPLARSNLMLLLSRDPDIETLRECCSGAEAVAEIRRIKPHLVFLDVQMPECDGFDVLELLGSAMPPAVIFVTAYDEYAVRAFEAGALDYLLKPFDDVRFRRALERAKARLAQCTQLRARTIDQLVIKDAGRVSFIKAADIDWIEAADYYACLHVGANTHLLRRSLSELEGDLDPHRFCRIHRSAIANLKRVRGLELTDDGGYQVVLESGTRLRLSRRYRKRLQIQLGVTRGDPG
jgi:two-component system LytT family response regulator